jgi:hypothetical protein
MKRRDVFLFLSFLTLFVLFAIFQNFSFPTSQLQQLSKKEFFRVQLRKFAPTYTFNNYIGESIEAPYGYKEEIERRIASEGDPVVFDHNKFIKNEFEGMPVYKDIKNFIEISGSESASPEVAPAPNCHAEYASDEKKSGPMKLRANPMRQTASLSVPGDIESQMMYDGDRKSMSIQFKKSLDKDAGVKVELDSEEKSGAIKFDVRW